MKEPYTFTSGIRSPIYTDNRLLIGIVNARREIVNSMMFLMKEQGIKVVTLSDLDRENNIPETKFTLQSTVLGQNKLNIIPNNIFRKIMHSMLNKWKYLTN